MTYISEFIVEHIDTSEYTLRSLKNIQYLTSKEIMSLDSGTGIPKTFTSLATNSTIFRWDFGDGSSIETTVNPYIHIFSTSGTYLVSHQSCYKCSSTGKFICSTGWCTKSVGLGVTPTTITSNTYDCLYQCSVTITVTWQNLDTVDHTFRPSIIIDNTNTVSYPTDVTVPVANTVTVEIDIPGTLLPVGNHTICPVAY